MSRSFTDGGFVPGRVVTEEESQAFIHKYVNSPAVSDSILDKAKEVIYGDREKTYGSPGKNLEVVANFWENYLHARGLWNDNASGLTPEDVCHMLSLLKIARLTNTPGHLDSLVDLCGYTALVERVNNANQQKEAVPCTPLERP